MGIDVKVNRVKLLDALNRVSGSVNDKSKLPILSHVLLDVYTASDGNEYLVLSGTNLDSFTQVKVPILGSNEHGKTTVSLKNLIDVVKKSSGEDISLIEGHSELRVHSKRSQFSLPSVSSDAFPEFPMSQTSKSVTVDAQDLSKLIDSVSSFIARPAETREVLKAVQLHFEPGLIIARGTDGRIAVFREKPSDVETSTGGSHDILISKEGVTALRKLIKNDTGKVNIEYTGRKVYFDTATGSVGSKVPEGNFPSFNNLFTDTPGTLAIVNKGQFLDAVRRALPFAKDRENPYLLQFQLYMEPDKLLIHAGTAFLGQTTEEVPIHLKGPGGPIAFDGRYLEKILSEAPGDNIEFHSKGRLNIAKFVGEGPSPTSYLLMPVKIESNKIWDPHENVEETPEAANKSIKDTFSISISRDALEKGLNEVSRSVSPRGQGPFSEVLIKAGGGNVFFTGTNSMFGDGQSGNSSTFTSPASVKKEGSILVNLKTLKNLSDNIPKGTDNITITGNSENRIKIKGDGINSDLAGSDASNFPSTPTITDMYGPEIKSSDLLDMIKHVSPYMEGSDYSGKLRLNAIKLSIGRDGIDLIASNSKNIGYIKKPVESSPAQWPDTTLLIDRSNIPALTKMLASNPGRIRIVVDGPEPVGRGAGDKTKIVHFISEDAGSVFSTTAESDNYPDIKNFIDSPAATSANLPTEDLSKALHGLERHAERFTKEIVNSSGNKTYVEDMSQPGSAVFKFGSDGHLRINASNGESSSEASVPIKFDGPDITLKLLLGPIMRALDTSRSPVTSLSFSDNGLLIKMHPEGDKSKVTLFTPAFSRDYPSLEKQLAGNRQRTSPAIPGAPSDSANTPDVAAPPSPDMPGSLSSYDMIPSDKWSLLKRYLAIYGAKNNPYRGTEVAELLRKGFEKLGPHPQVSEVESVMGRLMRKNGYIVGERGNRELFEGIKKIVPLPELSHIKDTPGALPDKLTFMSPIDEDGPVTREELDNFLRRLNSYYDASKRGYDIDNKMKEHAFETAINAIKKLSDTPNISELQNIIEDLSGKLSSTSDIRSLNDDFNKSFGPAIHRAIAAAIPPAPPAPPPAPGYDSSDYNYKVVTPEGYFGVPDFTSKIVPPNVLKLITELLRYNVNKKSEVAKANVGQAAFSQDPTPVYELAGILSKAYSEYPPGSGLDANRFRTKKQISGILQAISEGAEPRTDTLRQDAMMDPTELKILRAVLQGHPSIYESPGLASIVNKVMSGDEVPVSDAVLLSSYMNSRRYSRDLYKNGQYYEDLLMPTSMERYRRPEPVEEPPPSTLFSEPAPEDPLAFFGLEHLPDTKVPAVIANMMGDILSEYEKVTPVTNVADFRELHRYLSTMQEPKQAPGPGEKGLDLSNRKISKDIVSILKKEKAYFEGIEGPDASSDDINNSKRFSGAVQEIRDLFNFAANRTEPITGTFGSDAKIDPFELGLLKKFLEKERYLKKDQRLSETKPVVDRILKKINDLGPDPLLRDVLDVIGDTRVLADSPRGIAPMEYIKRILRTSYIRRYTKKPLTQETPESPVESPNQSELLKSRNALGELPPGESLSLNAVRNLIEYFKGKQQYYDQVGVTKNSVEYRSKILHSVYRIVDEQRAGHYNNVINIVNELVSYLEDNGDAGRFGKKYKFSRPEFLAALTRGSETPGADESIKPGDTRPNFFSTITGDAADRLGALYDNVIKVAKEHEIRFSGKQIPAEWSYLKHTGVRELPKKFADVMYELEDVLDSIVDTPEFKKTFASNLHSAFKGAKHTSDLEDVSRFYEAVLHTFITPSPLNPTARGTIYELLKQRYPFDQDPGNPEIFGDYGDGGPFSNVLMLKYLYPFIMKRGIKEYEKRRVDEHLPKIEGDYGDFSKVRQRIESEYPRKPEYITPDSPIPEYIWRQMRSSLDKLVEDIPSASNNKDVFDTAVLDLQSEFDKLGANSTPSVRDIQEAIYKIATRHPDIKYYNGDFRSHFETFINPVIMRMPGSSMIKRDLKTPLITPVAQQERPKEEKPPQEANIAEKTDSNAPSESAPPAVQAPSQPPPASVPMATTPAHTKTPIDNEDNMANTPNTPTPGDVLPEDWQGLLNYVGNIQKGAKDAGDVGLFNAATGALDELNGLDSPARLEDVAHILEYFIDKIPDKVDQEKSQVDIEGILENSFKFMGGDSSTPAPSAPAAAAPVVPAPPTAAQTAIQNIAGASPPDPLAQIAKAVQAPSQPPPASVPMATTPSAGPATAATVPTPAVSTAAVPAAPPVGPAPPASAPKPTSAPPPADAAKAMPAAVPAAAQQNKKALEILAKSNSNQDILTKMAKDMAKKESGPKPKAPASPQAKAPEKSPVEPAPPAKPTAPSTPPPPPNQPSAEQAATPAPAPPAPAPAPPAPTPAPSQPSLFEDAMKIMQGETNPDSALSKLSEFLNAQAPEAPITNPSRSNLLDIRQGAPAGLKSIYPYQTSDIYAREASMPLPSLDRDTVAKGLNLPPEDPRVTNQIAINAAEIKARNAAMPGDIDILGRVARSLGERKKPFVPIRKKEGRPLVNGERLPLGENEGAPSKPGEPYSIYTEPKTPIGRAVMNRLYGMAGVPVQGEVQAPISPLEEAGPAAALGGFQSAGEAYANNQSIGDILLNALKGGAIGGTLGAIGSKVPGIATPLMGMLTGRQIGGELQQLFGNPNNQHPVAGGLLGGGLGLGGTIAALRYLSTQGALPLAESLGEVGAGTIASAATAPLIGGTMAGNAIEPWIRSSTIRDIEGRPQTLGDYLNPAGWVGAAVGTANAMAGGNMQPSQEDIMGTLSNIPRGYPREAATQSLSQILKSKNPTDIATARRNLVNAGFDDPTILSMFAQASRMAGVNNPYKGFKMHQQQQQPLNLANPVSSNAPSRTSPAITGEGGRVEAPTELPGLEQPLPGPIADISAFHHDLMQRIANAPSSALPIPNNTSHTPVPGLLSRGLSEVESLGKGIENYSGNIGSYAVHGLSNFQNAGGDYLSHLASNISNGARYVGNMGAQGIRGLGQGISKGLGYIGSADAQGIRGLGQGISKGLGYIGSADAQGMRDLGQGISNIYHRDIAGVPSDILGMIHNLMNRPARPVQSFIGPRAEPAPLLNGLPAPVLPLPIFPGL